MVRAEDPNQTHSSHTPHSRASDSSGRYGGQTFFGNDFWLGSKSFCTEINLQNKDDKELKNEDYIEMNFFVALIQIAIDFVAAEPKLLQLGQCLPSHCSTSDVYRILKEDPKSKLISDKNTCNAAKKSSRSVMEIVEVRTVPGSYSLLNDSKFFIVSSVIFVLVIVMILGTWYEAWYPGSKKCIVSNAMKSDHTVGSAPIINNAEMIMEIDGTKKSLSDMNKNITNECVHIVENDIYNSNTKQRKNTDFSTDILLCFAAGANSKTILSVETANKDSLTCIHGLRLYSLLWTIMVHTYLQLFAVGGNRYGRNITERSFSYQIIGNATFSVDTFFFISGLLVVVLFYRSATTKRAIGIVNGKYIYENSMLEAASKIILSILYRFLRLTPAYLFVIISNELALKWTYGRSVFKPGIIDHITCDKFWWRNILYINNWYPVREMCMIWSWYLANDMQFYIIAIIILTLSMRYIKTSIIILVLLTICSWIISIFISIHFNYSYKVASPFESFDILYDKPWQRITPYIMGMFTGYIYNFKKTPPRMSSYLNALLWFLSLTIIISLIFGVWRGQLSVPATALYMSIGHTAWGLALVWITLSCCWGNAHFVNRLLSYRALYPLSRLSYCAYLLHPVVMMVTSFQMEAPIHLQHIVIIPIFFGNAVISFILSYFVSLLLEAPMVNLLKLIFKK
ncbi:nose resistant to fluoxetine protein 6 isoform X2 [Toxorhynchites rutilus septentrionalis]|uniref:nose resistant to fluoxetine protein 6 isoform X2 n=1 Tax=Toxorhynchites rutilus septentrionalis TaxID=329112 RepID=UPI00247935D7|nr:nose resistant to fluoxetine protein 6 isoform X2 [Toxorhynchites rutilus septentrionalis]